MGGGTLKGCNFLCVPVKKDNKQCNFSFGKINDNATTFRTAKIQMGNGVIFNYLCYKTGPRTSSFIIVYML